jgi:hypothetical protein
MKPSMILGMPFLVANNLVVDPVARKLVPRSQLGEENAQNVEGNIRSVMAISIITIMRFTSSSESRLCPYMKMVFLHCPVELL